MIKKGKVLISLCVALCMMLTQALFTNVAFADTTAQGTDGVVTRVAGADRYQTAVEISKKGWSSSDYAVLVTGENFPDALCAGPLAAKLNAPVLLTQSRSLNSDTLSELKRLEVKHIVIVGGTGAVSQAVETSLKSAGFSDVQRISGQNRYETSIKVAQQIDVSGKAVLATGRNYPDALSISSIASGLKMPILLTDGNTLTDAVKNYLTSNNVTTTYIIGGTGVIAKNIESLVPGAVRIAGIDRYETNKEVMNEFSNWLNFSNIYVAVGNGFADALTGSVLAVKTSSPLVLVNNTMPSVTGDFLKSKVTLSTVVTALGGAAVLPSSITDCIVSYINAAGSSSTVSGGSGSSTTGEDTELAKAKEAAEAAMSAYLAAGGKETDAVYAALVEALESNKTADILSATSALNEATEKLLVNQASLAQAKEAAEASGKAYLAAGGSTSSAEYANLVEALESNNTSNILSATSLLNQATEAIEAAQANLAQVKEQLEAAQAKVASDNETIEADQAQLASDKEAVEAAQAKLDEANEKVEADQAQLAQDKEKLEATQSGTDSWAEANETVEAAEAALAQANEAVETAQANLNAAQAKVASDNETIEAAQAQLALDKEAVEAAQANVTQAQETLNAKQGK